MTQCMPLSCMALESCMCIDEKWLPGLKMSFTQRHAIAMAKRRMLTKSVSVMLL